MNSTLYFDPQEIQRTISLLKPDGELFEIRILKGKQILSGYFRSAEKLLAALHKLPEEVLTKGNVYFSLQEIHPGCEARSQWNTLLDSRFEQLHMTSENDILRYRYLPIDLDPVRPAGISSTDEELEAAATVAQEVISFMSAQGYGKHILAFSGNGYHVLFPISTDVTEEALIKAELEQLNQLFSTQRCKVDVTLSNPSRILKLYGTYARKGRSTADRPHRLSRILEVVGYEGT